MITPRRNPVPLLALCALLLFGVGCVETVKSRSYGGLGEHSITKVGVAPLSVNPRVIENATADSQPTATAAIIARHLAEGLSRRGAEVIAPSDMGRALAVGEEPTRQPPRAVALAAHEEFGVDAVLIGELTRLVERRGKAAGTLQPASVGFRVALYSAPGAQRLWAAQFDETQQPLTENVLSASRYPGGGSRWLTAEELATWGARETALTIPLIP